MVDPLSLITGIVTLTGAVNGVVKYARTFHRNAEELSELQEQLDQFANLLSDLDAQQTAHAANVTSILGKAKKTLEQLENLLVTRISAQADKSSRIRRRSWVKNKSRICKLQSSLQEHRTNLVLAFSTNNTFYAARSEATLASISREVGCSTDSSTSFRAQLSAIENSVSKTHDAVVLQNNTFNSILQSIAVDFRRQLYAADEPSSSQGEMSSGKEGKYYIKHATFLNDTPSDGRATSGSSLPTQPMTPLECSQKFYPELYTTDARVPLSCLVVNSSWEISEGVDLKTNLYKLFYLQSSRHWKWLTISIQIPRSSKYWATTKTTPQEELWEHESPLMALGAVLPYSLLKKMQVTLCQAERFNGDATLCLTLSDQDTIKWRPQISPVDTLSDLTRSLSATSKVLNYLQDLGCERYVESQVIQIEMVDPPNYFCSSLTTDGALVLEIKFRDTTPSPELLYAIRALHCMNGVRGFSKLVGIVTDDSRRYLKSYLVELPKACRSIVSVADPSLSWERREKWAAQLIRGVSHAHAQGFVIGSLTTWSRPVIDDTDSVRFWYFVEKFITGRTVGAYYPPEHHYVRNISQQAKEADRPFVTTKTDIFHLGMLLWLLAENEPETHCSPVCGRMRCDSRGGKNDSCDFSHAEPVALPPLPDSIPNYFRDIVDACRRAEPSERPAARELLEMFPPLNISQHFQPGSSGLKTADYRLLAEGMKTTRPCCSLCKKRPMPLPFFHCHVCTLGDFDLCGTCYENGMHCYDDSHLLVELGKIGSWIVPQKYHSHVQSSGVREVIDL